MNELSSQYLPQESERKWSSLWQENHVFHPQVNQDKNAFTVVIPPPNVTGILHMGHALNNTLQDILVRYKRMQGFEVLWMVGTDHAGIATQNVVEKQLAKEGKKRQDLGREAFVTRLWDWQKQYGGTIIEQLKRLGASCDWDRTRFTMDDDYSQAVKHVFVKLFEKDLIYQGQYIINWCPRCQTALSDEEAEHKEVKGALYHIRYPFKNNPSLSITVATTRPETMLGDTAVAVNPKDKRYRGMIGEKLLLPLLHREISIIADDFVDPKFGSGAVKVTPAHDPNDFVMGQRHHLAFINIMHPDGRLNESAGAFNNYDRFVARKAIIEALKAQDLLVKIDEHTHAVGHCYRCQTVVEPFLSKQWFVRMKPLAQPAIKAVKSGQIKFFPKRFTKVYLNWMENIQDWCISRQIWWGHRIPVWYCQKCPQDNNVIVSIDTPKHCPRCRSSQFIQDEDVLDTWFSSWLWPFATLNWPKQNKDLSYFYPTGTLFTASEIIFFWVARMIMAGLEFMKEIPFSHAYIHGTVRDSKGQKMSKSLGNAIDPLEIINEYGADALRFSLILNSGQDLYIAKDKFEIGRNFANKIWNATRLILLKVNESPNTLIAEYSHLKLNSLSLEHRWIINRFYTTLKNVEKSIEQYRFSEAENLVYEFFWGNFCDWYLEMIKESLTERETQILALFVLEQSIKMLHPFMPFLTEEIWHILNPNTSCCLAQTAWPKKNLKATKSSVAEEMQPVMDIVSLIRQLRVQWNISPHQMLSCICVEKNEAAMSVIEHSSAMIKRLAKLESLSVTNKDVELKESAMGLKETVKVLIPLKGIIDISQEKQRLENQLHQTTTALEALKQRLKNVEFLKKAPADIVDKEKLRQQSLESKIKEITLTLKSLG